LGGVCGQPCTTDAECGDDNTCDGLIRWQTLFRRTQAPATNADILADWNATNLLYYDIVDSNGFKVPAPPASSSQSSTASTAWLDALNPFGLPNQGLGATSFAEGLRAGPVPRPGGKNPQFRVEGMRAST
jgi:hypothetical protein